MRMYVRAAHLLNGEVMPVYALTHHLSVGHYLGLDIGAIGSSI